MEAEFIQLPPWASFSVFTAATYGFSAHGPCLSSVSCFFLVGFRSSYDLNFQLCWWFSQVCIQALHPVGCSAGRTWPQNSYFSCFHPSSSASLSSQHLSFLPVTQPESDRLFRLLPLPLSISSQKLHFNHQIYSLNQCHLSHYLAASVIHLSHKSDHITTPGKNYEQVECMHSSLPGYLQPFYLFSWPPEVINNHVCLRPALFTERFWCCGLCDNGQQRRVSLKNNIWT